MRRKKRNYRREYDTYQGTLRQKRRRAERNKDRRAAIRKYGRSALRGKDVDHIHGIKGPTRIVSRHRNRGFRRTRTNKNLGLP